MSSFALTEFRGESSVSSSQPFKILLCAKANSPSFSQNSPSLPQNSVRLSEFSSPKQYSRNSIRPVSKIIFFATERLYRSTPKYTLFGDFGGQHRPAKLVNDHRAGCKKIGPSICPKNGNILAFGNFSSGLP